MNIFDGRSFHHADDFLVVAGLGVVEVDSLYTGDLVNHMNPEVGRTVSDTCSDVVDEAVTDVVVVVIGGWLLVVDSLKGL